MRQHQQIIADAGKDEEVARALGVRPFNVRDWRLRKSIPAERWQPMVTLGWTTFEELASQVAAPLPSANQNTAQSEGKAA